MDHDHATTPRDEHTAHHLSPVTETDAVAAARGNTGAEGESRGSSRRRLLLAGAVGAVAGAIGGSSRPVLAQQGLGDQGALIMGSNDIFKNSAPQYTNSANVASVATVIKASPNYTNYMFVAGNYVFRADKYPLPNNIDSYYRIKTVSKDGVTRTFPSVALASN